MSKMYVYELPFDINKELCRLLDTDDIWRDLAGSYMQYPPFEINEMDQIARRQGISPTSVLLSKWGQLNHNVEELFTVLYRMKHRPALNCIKSLVREKFQLLLSKRDNKNGSKVPTATIDENGNRPAPQANLQSQLPLVLFDQSQGSTSMSDTQDSAADSTSSDGTTSSTGHMQSQTQANEYNELIRKHVSAIPCIKYEDLKEATGNWSEANMLGKGGFGQVYKGDLRKLAVAVKRLKNDGRKNSELIQELCLNQYRHDNILALYGYSLGGPEALLVYQLMSGGTLEQRLRCRTTHPPLSWPQRHRVAHGVARGLLFLHTMNSTPLIHGDIKPANILLDQCAVPKIGDFGLARTAHYAADKTHVRVSKVHGTRVYLPSDYLQSLCLCPAVDTFSFGVVVAELASALRPLDAARHHPLLTDHIHGLARAATNDFAALEDRMIIGTHNSNPQLCRQFMAIAIHCTEYSRRQRPTMLDVFKRLDAMNFPGKDSN